MTHLRHFVVLGDSISEGIGDTVDNEPVVSAFDLVAATLRRTHPDIQYTNLAERGLLVAEVRERQLAQALELNPDLVSVIAGANDALKGRWDVHSYEEHLGAMLAALTAQRARVFTATWPNFTLRLSLPAERQVRLSRQLQEGNEVTRRLSQQYGTVLVDFWEHSVDRERGFWSRDGIHPNTLGYREIAELFLAIHDQ